MSSSSRAGYRSAGTNPLFSTTLITGSRESGIRYNPSRNFMFKRNCVGNSSRDARNIYSEKRTDVPTTNNPYELGRTSSCHGYGLWVGEKWLHQGDSLRPDSHVLIEFGAPVHLFSHRIETSYAITSKYHPEIENAQILLGPANVKRPHLWWAGN